MSLFISFASADLSAQTRLVRHITEEQGLVAPPVWALAQDSTGFLWIGAEGGLFRFDGVEVRRWARDTLRDVITQVAVSPAGRIVARQRNGELFEIAPGDVARRMPLPAPPGPNLFGSIAFDRDGRLWAVFDDSVFHTDGAGGWRAVPRSALGGEAVRRVDAGATGSRSRRTTGCGRREPMSRRTSS